MPLLHHHHSSLSFLYIFFLHATLDGSHANLGYLQSQAYQQYPNGGENIDILACGYYALRCERRRSTPVEASCHFQAVGAVRHANERIYIAPASTTPIRTFLVGQTLESLKHHDPTADMMQIWNSLREGIAAVAPQPAPSDTRSNGPFSWGPSPAMTYLLRTDSALDAFYKDISEDQIWFKSPDREGYSR
ncbi:hypothetical protein NCS56_01258600 [Fusarium sp. Ph1]|nr:hypothetical protein NCS56_01258600 [Fusarium sp. Ph1]